MTHSRDAEEAALRDKGGANTPSRLPRLFMVAADAQTDFAIGLESAARCHESEARWAERVCRG